MRLRLLGFVKDSEIDPDDVRVMECVFDGDSDSSLVSVKLIERVIVRKGVSERLRLSEGLSETDGLWEEEPDSDWLPETDTKLGVISNVSVNEGLFFDLLREPVGLSEKVSDADGVLRSQVSEMEMLSVPVCDSEKDHVMVSVGDVDSVPIEDKEGDGLASGETLP